MLDAGLSLKPGWMLSAEVILNDRVTDDHIAQEDFLLARGKEIWSPTTDSHDKGKFHACITDFEARSHARGGTSTRSGHVTQHDIVVPDSACDVCICIAGPFAVYTAQSIVYSVEKRFDGIGFQCEGTDDRDREFVSMFRLHAGLVTELG